MTVSISSNSLGRTKKMITSDEREEDLQYQHSDYSISIHQILEYAVVWPLLKLDFMLETLWIKVSSENFSCIAETEIFSVSLIHGVLIMQEKVIIFGRATAICDLTRNDPFIMRHIWDIFKSC